MTQAKRTRTVGQWLSFAMLVGALGLFSFVCLPSLAELSPVRDRMELNDAKQIDGGATFYTDQPFLEKLLTENELKRDGNGTSTHDR